MWGAQAHAARLCLAPGQSRSVRGEREAEKVGVTGRGAEAGG